VLSHGKEIGLEDIPRSMREDGRERRLPVVVGPIVREGERAEGRELEFIVRSLVELKLQVEQLRRRVDEDRQSFVFGGVSPSPAQGLVMPPVVTGMRGEVEDQRGATIPKAGTTMAEIERAAIENALRDTRGNRRKAAEILAIGERTLYRKLKEYNLPLGEYDSDN